MRPLSDIRTDRWARPGSISTRSCRWLSSTPMGRSRTSSTLSLNGSSMPKVVRTTTTMFRGQGGQGPWDVRGAIFQLEAMRRLTPIVARQTGTALRDPPELLEKLVLGYRTLDRASPTEGYGKTALALAREVRSAYLESGQNEDVVRVDSLITTLQRR